jgi:hypothetical protein
MSTSPFPTLTDAQQDAIGRAVSAFYDAVRKRVTDMGGEVGDGSLFRVLV